MIYYVAGPMTGIPGYNWPLFEQVESWLQNKFEADYDAWEASSKVSNDPEPTNDVLTPFDADNYVWFAHFNRPFDPWTDKCEYNDPLLKEITIHNQINLLRADAIVLLPGWTSSKGSQQEVITATNLRLKIYEWVDTPDFSGISEVVPKWAIEWTVFQKVAA